MRVGADDNGDGDNVDQSPARARIGDLEVRALEPGPEGNDTTIEVSDPPEGSPEGTVRIVVTRGDEREEHEAVPLSGRGNVVNTLNRGRLVRVELDPAVTQLEDLPRGITSLSGGELVHVDVTQARLSPDDYIGDAADRTGFAGLETIPDVTMVAVPDAMAAYQKGVIDLEGLKAIQLGMIAHCELMGNRVAILDAPPNLNAQQVKDWRVDQAGYDSKFAALYYPWVKVFDPASGENIFVPPSGHVAGIYGRNDDTRGVHKAPANEVIRGAIDLEINITKGEHDQLNPVAVNCIRAFPGRGIRVWGARTLSSDPEWRYLNVRRLFNYLEDSILNGTQWAVFEPNDQVLWAKVRRSIAAFLTMEWRKGALFGATPERGLLRQVRRRDEPGRGDRPRPAHVRGRRGAGQAGRVRDLPSVAVLRRRQPRRRVTAPRPRVALEPTNEELNHGPARSRHQCRPLLRRRVRRRDDQGHPGGVRPQDGTRRHRAEAEHARRQVRHQEAARPEEGR